jgi:tRNA A-37 threonylcarbamoyl transferase component Bud32/membrane-associated phospholipid phosphatase
VSTETTRDPFPPPQRPLAAPPMVLSPPTARRGGRRRRPTGKPPPLPRSIGISGKGWLVALAVLFGWIVIAHFWAWARRVTNRIDIAILRLIEPLRVDPLVDVARAVNRLLSGWWVSAVAGVLLILLVVFRRWRHLFTFVLSVFVLELLGQFLYNGFQRPRPFDVVILGPWRGFSLPSAPIAVVSFVVIGIAYSMIVAGRSRTVAKVIGVAVIAVLAAARLYLAVDHPFDILVGAALGVAIPLNAFRYFTPNDAFPVAYGGGKTAHLDVGGRRGEAIRQGVQEQLGLTILDLRPVGLAGSGGSTPLRLHAAGDPDTYLFGKLYAMNHVRADRWYKLGRTILYGRLEDEAPFQSVRRLALYEDSMLRLLRDCGLPTAAPYGIVELTPEREYLLVTEFFDGAEEIGDAVVDDGVIDDGLAMVRRMWDAGLAHRDVKPANLLVKDGRLKVIDVAFAQIRPSPWRQAVDLANMMLVLAVRSDPQRVYERAMAYFTPDDVAEAFAAARGIASPTQLRHVLKKDGRDLVAQFRAMAPARRPISLQRWSVRRVALAVAIVVGAIVAITSTYQMFTPEELAIDAMPSCGTDNVMVLMAQSVPTATQVPCIAALPSGWTLGGVRIRSYGSRFWLDSDQAGEGAVQVTLRRPEDCDLAGVPEVPSDEPGFRRFEVADGLPPGLRASRFYSFDGGCVTYRFDFGPRANGTLMFDVDAALAFQPREALVVEVERETDLRLCGAGAPPCAGEP